MEAKIISGKEISLQIREELKIKVKSLAEQGCRPGLAVILVGQNPASVSYVKGKEDACKEIGIYSDSIKLSAETSMEDLLALVEEKNKDSKIDGILVQLPLPKHIDEEKIIEAITPEKDVDGFHPISVGKMVLGEETFVSCTPAGIIELLVRSNIETNGKHVVVIGRSNIVGKPMANLLIRKEKGGNATVTICHTATPDIKKWTLQADIIIVAAGRTNTLTADMVKDGAVVIDVGVNRIQDDSKKSGFRLVGDVDFEAIKEKASYITPVPGGVGPMTITMLMNNCVLSATRRLEKSKNK